MTQVIVTVLLQQWGISGFEDFLLKLQALYTHKSAVAAAAADQHLTGLATWEPCSAGMFMWLRLTSGRDLSTVMDQMVEAKVAVVPGSFFAAEHSDPGDAEAAGEGGVTADDACAAGCPFFRVSFATCSDEELQVCA
ncbi:MAG: hypothetical protein WDW38_002722 [Sanguina aurantia]